MGGADEDWLTAAMTDDLVVVELLMRLQGGDPEPSSRKTPSLAMKWSVRQRRTRSLMIVKNQKKMSQRASPSTPLTWSCATSLSGGSGGSGGGCYEQSSEMPPAKLSTADRSKVNEKPNSKRPRKKKTLSELKEEESSLLKEQRMLKKELAKLRMHLGKQRETNTKLKRVKVNSNIPMLNPPQIGSQTVLDNKPPSAPEDNSNPVTYSNFILPDLNMPFEEEAAACLEVTCGVS